MFLYEINSVSYTFICLQVYINGSWNSIVSTRFVARRFSQEVYIFYEKVLLHTLCPCSSSSPSYIAPNSGLFLWMQQFCAMFVKRVLNSLRFYGSYISQIFLPLVFILLALVLAKTIGDPNKNDPSRELRLDNSALSDNVFFFYAQFGENNLTFSVNGHTWFSVSPPPTL